MQKLIILILFFSTLIIDKTIASHYTLYSPDKRIKVEVRTAEKVTYQVYVNSEEVIAPSPVSLSLKNGRVLGANARVTKVETRTVQHKVKTLFETSSEIEEHFNELVLRTKDSFSIVFRAFNNGVAYRFETAFKGDLIVTNEEATFNFPNNPKGYFIEFESFENTYEDNYLHKHISEVSPEKYAILPFLVESSAGPKVLITEADLLDYPGLYLKASEGGLKGVLPQFPKSSEVGGDRDFNKVVTARENFIAKTQGSRTFPWRVMIIAEQDKDLIQNHLVYLLSTPSKIKDVSWIKPGKVAWDWWNALNLSGVDFKTGFNTETYKYFIDFAAKNGIEYVNLDEGWSHQQDLMKITTELDLEEVIRYAHEKNVKLILWAVWHVLDRQMQVALDQFEKWGIAGVKVDFMNRDDQEAVNFYERLAVECAKRKLIINFHGAYKPTGLRRTYPNVINREGVLGLEYNKWSDLATPEHDLIIPFIRMAVGPMDYTPGAMRNGSIDNFQPVFEQPMSQGSRCHQLAMFVAYDAPLQMLADAPTAYESEPIVLDFLSKVPTVWDETQVIDGKIGDYLVIARRKGNTWYVAAMTDENERELSIRFDFLKDQAYEAEIFSDGINASRSGQDYKKNNLLLNKGDTYSVLMAKGGGWVAVLTPAK